MRSIDRSIKSAGHFGLPGLPFAARRSLEPPGIADCGVRPGAVVEEERKPIEMLFLLIRCVYVRGTICGCGWGRAPALRAALGSESIGFGVRRLCQTIGQQLNRAASCVKEFGLARPLMRVPCGYVSVNAVHPTNPIPIESIPFHPVAAASHLPADCRGAPLLDPPSHQHQYETTGHSRAAAPPR